MSLTIRFITKSIHPVHLVRRSSPIVSFTPSKTKSLSTAIISETMQQQQQQQQDEQQQQQTTSTVVDDIEELHRNACISGDRTYIDPPTGFTVFTEISHLKRGTCCGNLCRHCPYGFENVRNGVKRPAKLRSGDFDAAEALLQAIDNGNPIFEATLPPPTESSTSNSNTRNGTPRPPSKYNRRRRQQQQQQQQDYQQQEQRAAFSTSSATAVTGTTTTATEQESKASMTSKNVPYTRKGDGGSSQLGTGERRAKDDCNFEALGTVDELCSIVGVVHSHLEQDVDYGNLSELLLDVMSRLFDIGSHVAKPKQSNDFSPNGLGDGFDAKHVDDLEVWINEMTEMLPELNSFILPTGAKAAAHLHVARTVCRRAERRMVPLVRDDTTCDPNALRYMNRLSDFFFVAARWVNYCQDQEEIQYQRDTPNTTQRQMVTRSLQES